MTDKPRGVETNGLGRVTTSHMNLTRTLADVARADADYIARWREDHRYSGPTLAQHSKIPFAGK